MPNTSGLPPLYASIRESRHASVFPFVAQRLADIDCRRLLDFGGGDGVFLAGYLPSCVREAYYYDIDAGIAAAARARQYALQPRFLAGLDALQPASLDAITMLGVWMHFRTEAQCIAELATLRRLLKADGRLIAAVTHPCFRDEVFSTFKTDFDMQRYLAPGSEFDVTIFDADASVTLRDTHWNLEAMSKQITRAGLAIAAIYERPDIEPARGAPWLILELAPAA